MSLEVLEIAGNVADDCSVFELPICNKLLVDGFLRCSGRALVMNIAMYVGNIALNDWCCMREDFTWLILDRFKMDRIPMDKGQLAIIVRPAVATKLYVSVDVLRPADIARADAAEKLTLEHISKYSKK